MARVADELALEEGDVDDGGVEVDELEDEHFERQVVVKVRLRAVHLWKKILTSFCYRIKMIKMQMLTKKPGDIDPAKSAVLFYIYIYDFNIMKNFFLH